jgi:glucokinase
MRHSEDAMKIGIDLGGSNLRVGVVGKGVLERVHKEPVGEPRDPETVVERITAIVEELARDEVAAAKKSGLGNPVSVGVGIAAMLCDAEGTVANSPHLRWRDVPFGKLLAARVAPHVRVGVYNDVNAIVWGEYVAGAARDCRSVLGVYVGTGIGGGLIVNGTLVDGATSCAGEIGHTKVRWT